VVISPTGSIGQIDQGKLGPAPVPKCTCMSGHYL